MPQNPGKRKRTSLESQIDEFINAYPGMRKTVILSESIVLHGLLRFHATHGNDPEVNDTFRLKIIVPFKFPSELPIVFEVGGRIPHDPDHHVNQSNGSLCLGSPLTLVRNIVDEPTLLGFAENCIIPYLYAISILLNNNITWIFGELEHGAPGLVHEYSLMFYVQDPNQIFQIMSLLGKKRRIANKELCPCQCGHRFGKCKIGINANRYRRIGNRKFFQKTALEFIKQLRSVY